MSAPSSVQEEDCTARFAVAGETPYPDLRLASFEGGGQADFRLDTGDVLAVADLAGAYAVVAPGNDEARVRELLGACPGRIYLGDVALLDADAVARLAAEFGSERIGVYLPARRIEVNWSLDTESNADFRVLTPSHCQPAFEVLWADGTRTGTLLTWWLQVMVEKGASSALLHLDLADDNDLNIAAGLVEDYGPRLWFSALSPERADFEQWVRWGQVRQLALASRTRAENPSLMALLTPGAEQQVA